MLCFGLKVVILFFR